MPRSLKDWQDEIAAGILEDLENLSGVSIGEMLADGIVIEGEYETYPVYEEPDQGAELDIDSDEGSTRDYFDDLFDDLDLTGDEEDSYGDE